MKIHIISLLYSAGTVNKKIPNLVKSIIQMKVKNIDEDSIWNLLLPNNSNPMASSKRLLT